VKVGENIQHFTKSVIIIMCKMKLNNIEKNVLMVALDHMQEHLSEVNEDIDMSEKLKALKSLINKIKKNYE